MDPQKFQPYTVKTTIFEGPFDLLLSLIESRKLFVNELTLAEVTQDYVNFVKGNPSLPINEATEFIVIAATLILIKSRSLLPNLSLTVDEEEKIIDLEARLKLYQRISESSQYLKSIFGKRPLSIIRERKVSDVSGIFLPDDRITPHTMHELAKGLIAALPKKVEPLPEIAVARVISLEEMIDTLTERITSSLETNFSDFITATSGDITDVKEKKVHVIVSFLAMLELVREGIIDVIQEMEDDDIAITKRSPEEIFLYK